MNEIESKKYLLIGCPNCGAKPDEECRQSTGRFRIIPHIDRCILAVNKTVLAAAGLMP